MNMPIITLTLILRCFVVESLRYYETECRKLVQLRLKVKGEVIYHCPWHMDRHNTPIQVCWCIPSLLLICSLTRAAGMEIWAGSDEVVKLIRSFGRGNVESSIALWLSIVTALTTWEMWSRIREDEGRIDVCMYIYIEERETSKSEWREGRRSWWGMTASACIYDNTSLLLVESAQLIVWYA